MSTISAKDGTQNDYRDWRAGRPIVFSHAWPLSADAWEDATFFFASRGYRGIAADRRGRGRSSQPSTRKIVRVRVPVVVYDGAPHGLPSTLEDRLNADVLEFAAAVPK